MKIIEGCTVIILGHPIEENNNKTAKTISAYFAEDKVGEGSDERGNFSWYAEHDGWFLDRDDLIDFNIDDRNETLKTNAVDSQYLIRLDEKSNKEAYKLEETVDV